VIEMGRRPIWTGETGQKVIFAVNAWLAEEGLAHSDETVTKAIEALRAGPPWNKWSQETLWRKYWVARKHHGNSPPPTEEDRWFSLLIKWCKEPKRNPVLISAEQAREMINQLIAVVPSHRRAHLDQLFAHMERRLFWNGRQKIEWLQSEVIARLAANPHDWPIPITRRGRPDLMAGRIETYLANAPGKRAHKQDILAALEIRNTSGQNALVSMVRAGRLVRVADGMYSLPTDGVSNYVPGQKAVVDVLAAGGSYTNAQLRARTGLTEGAIHAAVHHLVKQGKAIRIKRGLWARPGTAPPHIYARDAIIEALQSGSKTVHELMTATGKNRGEIWQALHRLKAKGLIHGGGQRGRLAAFALPPAHLNGKSKPKNRPRRRA
jgi:hypothetical protein